MIEVLRVDDRLLHGQVAVSWTRHYKVDVILVANNHLITDKDMQVAFRLATPSGVTLSMKSLQGAVNVINNPKHAMRKIMVITKDLNDAKFGFAQALKYAKTDKGQSIVVFNKKVIAVEDFKGTDNLIKRALKIKGKQKGGILVKVLKPGQEKRADIPVLGKNTILNLHDGNFSGVVIQANNSIIEDRKNVLELANSLNIFIMGTDGKF